MEHQAHPAPGWIVTVRIGAWQGQHRFETLDGALAWSSDTIRKGVVGPAYNLPRVTVSYQPLPSPPWTITFPDGTTAQAASQAEAHALVDRFSPEPTS